MSDLISRWAAISEIMEDLKDRSLHDDPATPEDYAEGYDEGIRNAAAIVLQVSSAQQWTYVEEELPKTIINEHTHDYQEYNCLCDFGDYGFDVRTYKFGNGHFWNGGGIVDKYVTAWQPLPEIPDALKPQPWEGGDNDRLPNT